jgi:hypothetical protein
VTANAYFPPPAFSLPSRWREAAPRCSIERRRCQLPGDIGSRAKIEIETVNEGGENRFALQLPGVTKSPNLVLRRGYVTKASFLSEWAAQPWDRPSTSRS